MARQKKTAGPKQKFNATKMYVCGRCKRRLNEYHVESVNGKLTTVCSPQRPCVAPSRLKGEVTP